MAGGLPPGPRPCETGPPPGGRRRRSRQWLDGADLVVGKHDAHQTSVRPDGIPDLLRRHHAVRRNVQQGNGKPLFLQGRQGMEHRVVLKTGGNDVPLPLPGTQRRRTAQSLGIRLAAAGSKCDLPGIRMQVPGKNLPGLGQLSAARCPGVCRLEGLAYSSWKQGIMAPVPFYSKRLLPRYPHKHTSVFPPFPIVLL